MINSNSTEKIPYFLCDRKRAERYRKVKKVEVSDPFYFFGNIGLENNMY